MSSSKLDLAQKKEHKRLTKEFGLYGRKTRYLIRRWRSFKKQLVKDNERHSQTILKLFY